MELVVLETPKNATLTATEQPKTARPSSLSGERSRAVETCTKYRDVSATSGGLRWQSREFVLCLGCYSVLRYKSALANASPQNRREAKSALTTSQPTKWNGTTRQRASII